MFNITCILRYRFTDFVKFAERTADKQFTAKTLGINQHWVPKKRDAYFDYADSDSDDDDPNSHPLTPIPMRTSSEAPSTTIGGNVTPPPAAPQPSSQPVTGLRTPVTTSRTTKKKLREKNITNLIDLVKDYPKHQDKKSREQSVDNELFLMAKIIPEAEMRKATFLYLVEFLAAVTKTDGNKAMTVSSSSISNVGIVLYVRSFVIFIYHRLWVSI